MSYCRMGSTSDVYLFRHIRGALICCGCRLLDRWSGPDEQAALEHLAEHIEAGHRVPERALERLRREMVA